MKFPENDRFTAGKERSLKQLLVVLEITLMLLFSTISRVRRFLPLLISPKISLPFYPASGETAWAPGEDMWPSVPPSTFTTFTMNTTGVVQVSLHKKQEQKHQPYPTNQTNRNPCFYKRQRINRTSEGVIPSAVLTLTHPHAFFSQWPQKFLVRFPKMLNFFFFFLNGEVRIQGWVPSVGQHGTASSNIPWAGWGLTLPGSERDICFLVRTAPSLTWLQEPAAGVQTLSCDRPREE